MTEQVTCDQGYRRHGCSDLTALLADRKRKKAPSIRKWMKRRNAIELVIRHLKAEHRLDRNRLRGVKGNRLNLVLGACGFNFRKRLRFLWPFFEDLTKTTSPPKPFSLSKIFPITRLRPSNHDSHTGSHPIKHSTFWSTRPPVIFQRRLTIRQDDFT